MPNLFLIVEMSCFGVVMPAVSAISALILPSFILGGLPGRGLSARPQDHVPRIAQSSCIRIDGHIPSSLLCRLPACSGSGVTILRGFSPLRLDSFQLCGSGTGTCDHVVSCPAVTCWDLRMYGLEFLPKLL